jgi:hypothetical protein
MGFQVVNGKVVKTKAGSTPKKANAANSKKAGKGNMTAEEVAAMKARYAAALAADPELAKNPSGHVQGGKRRVTRKTKKSKKSRTRSRR